MINTVDFKPNEEYFAAANSYCGFVSHFAKEFEPQKYERIFILKGGPGTGKSTLMKGIGSYFSDKATYVKAVYCSSDIHSLDGIILTKNNKSVCIIDGTSPHSIDPLYPGVKEEIIDLAKGINVTKLIESKDEIIHLNQTKKQHYKNAYALLEIAGKINDKIWQNYSKQYDYSRAEYIINELMSDKTNEKCACVNWRFISCFNKDSLVRFPLKEQRCELVTITGNGYSEYLFMNQLLAHVGVDNATHVYYTPLSDKMVECIQTPHFSFIVDNGNNTGLDTATLCDVDSESIRLTEYRNGLEILAAKAFTNASNCHFDLERIYKESVDFSYNEEVLGNITDKLAFYLEIK